MRMSRALPRSTRSVPPSGRGKSRPASDTPPVSLQFRQRVRTDAGCPHNHCATEAIRDDHAPVLQFANAPHFEPWPSSKATVAVPERNLRHLLRCHRTDRRQPQRYHGGESRNGRPRHDTAFVALHHRVAARPVLPVLFRFVPGLGPELVLFGPHSFHVHRLDIFRVYAADRLDLMDDLIRHPAPGLVTQPVPDPPAGNGHEHRERHEQISGHRSSKAPESRKLRVARRPCIGPDLAED